MIILSVPFIAMLGGQTISWNPILALLLPMTIGVHWTEHMYKLVLRAVRAINTPIESLNLKYRTPDRDSHVHPP